MCLQARTRSKARFPPLTALDEVAAVATLTAPPAAIITAQEERKREGCRNWGTSCVAGPTTHLEREKNRIKLEGILDVCLCQFVNVSV